MHVLTSMVASGLVPVFNHRDAATAKAIVTSLAAGGAVVIEFTNRDDHAFEVFSELERFCVDEHPDVVLGVGSVVDPATAGIYINLGASFVVGPLLNPDIATVCNRRKVAYAPGCATPTEIGQAEELGCEIVKVFPGGLVGGPAFVQAVLAPSPWTSIMPTGGVDITEESLKGWFDAGVVCVGVGSKLVGKDIVTSGDWTALERRTAETLETIERVRG